MVREFILVDQEISRFISQGRNFGLSYVGVTQRLSATDTSLVEISGLKKYWFRQSGENDLRKARNWIDKEHVWKLRDLEVGSCYLQHGSEIELIKVLLFEREKVIAQ